MNQSHQRPLLVFLHGLLGDEKEWLQIVDALPAYDVLCLALPGHGYNREVIVNDFSQTIKWLDTTLQEQIGNRDFILIGYSLGGRIALNYAYSNASYELFQKKQLSMFRYLKGVITEGAHLGLQSASERQKRYSNDQLWAEKFAKERLKQVLEQWYQQTVFHSLNQEMRSQLCQLRSQSLDGKSIAKMLMATSLNLQEDLRDNIKSSSIPLFYLCGEYDEKFTSIAKDNGLIYQIVNKAGHNAHRDNPQGFLQHLLHYLNKF